MANSIHNYECLGRKIDIHTFDEAEIPTDDEIKKAMRQVLSDDAKWHDTKFTMHVYPSSWSVISYSEHITNGRF